MMSPLTARLVLRLLTRLPALALVAACALLAGQARAQGIGAHRTQGPGSGGTATLEGSIITPTGELPESNMRVRLVNSDGAVSITLPDGRGAFTFGGLQSGYYTLYIDAGKDYERAEETVYIDAGNQHVSVPIILKLRPEANPALKGVPPPAADLFVRAVETSRKGDDKKAAELLGEAVAQHPQFGLAHAELGQLHLRAGRLDNALEEFRAAQKALPDDAELQLNYGSALTQKKDYAEAAKQLRAALKKMGKSPTSHFYLGLALVGLKDIEGAVREFQQAVRLGGPQMGAAHRYLGGIYWAQKQYKLAADELEMYVKLSPKATDAEQVKATIKDLRSKQ
jgi:tetratricopeptide (TPR) repeat protein